MHTWHLTISNKIRNITQRTHPLFPNISTVSSSDFSILGVSPSLTTGSSTPPASCSNCELSDPNASYRLRPSRSNRKKKKKRNVCPKFHQGNARTPFKEPFNEIMICDMDTHSGARQRGFIIIILKPLQH